MLFRETHCGYGRCTVSMSNHPSRQGSVLSRFHLGTSTNTAMSRVIIRAFCYWVGGFDRASTDLL